MLFLLLSFLALLALGASMACLGVWVYLDAKKVGANGPH